MITEILILGILLTAAYLYGLRKLNVAVLITVVAIGLAYYIVLLTGGHPGTFFDADPYSRLYPNLWEHAVKGDFGIDPQYAFREYFINGNGMNTVYFGFMPALLRGFASIFSDIYSYNLGNLSIVLAAGLAMGSLVFALVRLALLRTKTRQFTLGLVVAVLFASGFSYLSVWGRVHSEAIAWGAAWGVVFASFYAFWVFGKAAQHRWYHGAIMGASVGMALLSRPTAALTIAVPYACLVVWAAAKYLKRSTYDLKLLLPGIVCALLLAGLAAGINYQRWGNPLTFVQMDRHVELLKENPQRGADLRKAGEFNLNRLPSSFAYYLLPSRDNLSKEWPFVEIDQRLTIMNGAPQFDYIEGSRVPITMSMSFLLVLAALGVIRLRRLGPYERYASSAFIIGGCLTVLALFIVYAIALRYSVDFLPMLVFCAIVYLITLKHDRKKVPKAWVVGAHVLLVVSVFVATITALQYKITSGQINLQAEFKTDLSRKIHFPPEKGAKAFIIDGKPADAVYYQP